jgi:hypothetical protein
MLDGDLFDLLELIARRVRDDERPFGGLQLVLCGDVRLPMTPLATTAVPPLCRRCAAAESESHASTTATIVVPPLSQTADDRTTPLVLWQFFQLPPVAKSGSAFKFAFEAASWAACMRRVHELTKVFRQSDERFINALNQIRLGSAPPEVSALLRPWLGLA